MIVVVEGMDNSGKTTLTRWLAEQLRTNAMASVGDVREVHSAGPGKDERELLGRVDEATAWDDDDATSYVVMDRCSLVSEHVFGPTLRGSMMIRPLHWLKAWSRLVVRSMIVYCRPPEDDILDFGEREQMEGVRAKAELLLDAYDEFFSVHPPHFVYDWTMRGHDGRAEILNQIFLRERIIERQLRREEQSR